MITLSISAEACHWIAGTLFFLMTFALLKLAGMAIRNTL